MTEVAVGVIRRGDSVLLCRRKENIPYPLKWEFPGGKIEGGESAEDCLRREVFEELAITTTVGHELYHQQYVYPDSGSFDVRYFSIQEFEGIIENRAFSEIRWVAIADLQIYDVLEGNREVIRRIIETHSP